MSSYAALGILPDATDNQVRLAYKRKALECHPDRHAKDKDAATRNFVEINTAYRAILSERERKMARSQSSNSNQKRSSSAPPSTSADPEADGKDPSPGADPPSSTSSSSASTRSFKPTKSPSTKSTPSSSPTSSPFSSPTSSPYSTPASSPASSTTSLAGEDREPASASSRRPKQSATCEDAEDDDDDDDTASSFCSSSSSHTTMHPPDPGSSRDGTSASPRSPRAKLRKQQPKSKHKHKHKPKTASASSDDSHDYYCHHSHSGPTYSASHGKPRGDASTPDDHSGEYSHHTKHQTKGKEMELKEYYKCLPSLKDYPKVDLAAEWVYPLPLTLEDTFRGKRLSYRIMRRYLSGKTKSVVLDVDVPAGCRSGTKIVFRDAGHERRDKTKQDLVFVVKEKKHERFVRGSEWDGGDGEHREDEDDERSKAKADESNGNDTERDTSRGKGKEKESGGHRGRRNRKFAEEDLIMKVRLPWVDRLKEEKAKIVVSGIDEKEIMFEVDCRSRKSEKEEGKITGLYMVDGAGMPVRAKDAARGAKAVGADESGKRGKLIIRWEIFTPTPSSSSKWEAFKQIFTFGR